MASQIEALPIPEESVCQKLLRLMITGPLDNNLHVLDTLSDENVKMRVLKALLPIAISLRKPDWVEEVLARGADPDMMDGSNVTPLHLAEAMALSLPEDSACREVLRMVRLVQRVRVSSRGVTSTEVEDDVSEPLTQPSTGDSDNGTSVMSINGPSLDQSLNSLANSLSSNTSSMHALQREIHSLVSAVHGRDTIIASLETAVTTSAEEMTSLKERFESTMSSRNPPSPNSVIILQGAVRCIDTMMEKTVIMDKDDSKVSRVRELYESLYNEDAMIACVLKVLCSKPSVKVQVDCDSKNISRMKQRYVVYFGFGQNGWSWYPFPVFNERTIYLEAKVDGTPSESYVRREFAARMTQMCLFLTFNNHGRPYKDGDTVHEQEYKKALQEAEEKVRNGSFYKMISGIHISEKELAKEVEFAAVVPRVLAEQGSTLGRHLLQENVPLLYKFFIDHVMKCLFAKIGCTLFADTRDSDMHQIFNGGKLQN